MGSIRSASPVADTATDSVDTDVLILGAGPAGCCAALNLAPFCRVLLIDRHAAPQPRAGESLPPAANKLLADMGLLAEFTLQGHLPCFGNQSRWGSDTLTETDFLRDPQGHGWHLNRPVFERWLRDKAQQRGATLWVPYRLKDVADGGDGGDGGDGAFRSDAYRWTVTLDAADDHANGAAPLRVRAKVLIDAGGRTPGVAKRLGAQRVSSDKLCCAWSIGVPGGGQNPGSARAGMSYIESTQNGWWYTAPVPHGRRVVAFHADADDDSLPWMRSARTLLAQAATQPSLAEYLGAGGWGGPSFQSLQAASTAQPQHAGRSEFGFTSAHSATTQPCTGPGWLCVGDAALSFDPLSAQGIFNALYTGLVAAEAVHRHLSEGADLAGYAAQIDGVAQAYRARLGQSYGAERRFGEGTFWQRRDTVISQQFV